MAGKGGACQAVRQVSSAGMAGRQRSPTPGTTRGGGDSGRRSPLRSQDSRDGEVRLMSILDLFRLDGNTPLTNLLATNSTVLLLTVSGVGIPARRWRPPKGNIEIGLLGKRSGAGLAP